MPGSEGLRSQTLTPALTPAPPGTPFCLLSTPGTQTIILHFQLRSDPPVWLPERLMSGRRGSWFAHGHTRGQGPSWADPGPPCSRHRHHLGKEDVPPQTQGLGLQDTFTTTGASLVSHPSAEGQLCS